jgi:uncharacterized protein YdhG (YjbR/CyaY superfamily)
MNTVKPNNIETYIASFPEATQKALKQVKRSIKTTAPLAEELISYGSDAASIFVEKQKRQKQ